MERLSDFAADIVNDLYENSDWYGDRSWVMCGKLRRALPIESILPGRGGIALERVPGEAEEAEGEKWVENVRFI